MPYRNIAENFNRLSRVHERYRQTDRQINRQTDARQHIANVNMSSRSLKIAKNSPSAHHRTNLSGYIFATKARIDNRKNLLNSNVSPTYPHNIVNFGPLAAEICWRVLDTPANFNGFRVLAALLHGTLVVGDSQTLRRWTEDATYIRQGGHHVGHWPTFLVTIIIIVRFWSCVHGL